MTAAIDQTAGLGTAGDAAEDSDARGSGLSRGRRVSGVVATLAIAACGMAASALCPTEELADATCALASGLALAVVGATLACDIVSGRWSASDEGALGRDAGYGLAGAATVCVVLLVLGVSGLGMGVARLLALLA